MDICLYMYKLLLNSVYILFHECKNTTLRYTNVQRYL